MKDTQKGCLVIAGLIGLLFVAVAAGRKDAATAAAPSALPVAQASAVPLPAPRAKEPVVEKPVASVAPQPIAAPAPPKLVTCVLRSDKEPDVGLPLGDGHIAPAGTRVVLTGGSLLEVNVEMISGPLAGRSARVPREWVKCE